MTEKTDDSPVKLNFSFLGWKAYPV